MYRKSQQITEPGKQPESTPKPQAQDSLKLTDQYIALLILVFCKAGLIDVSSRYFLKLQRQADTKMSLGIDMHA